MCSSDLRAREVDRYMATNKDVPFREIFGEEAASEAAHNASEFRHFEQTVISVFEKGVLTPALLTELMEQYRGTDIDPERGIGLLTSSGLTAEEVVITVLGRILPERPEHWGTDPRRLNHQQHVRNEAYREECLEVFDAITHEFGWG